MSFGIDDSWSHIEPGTLLRLDCDTRRGINGLRVFLGFDSNRQPVGLAGYRWSQGDFRPIELADLSGYEVLVLPGDG